MFFFCLRYHITLKNDTDYDEETNAERTLKEIPILNPFQLPTCEIKAQYLNATYPE